MKEEMEARGKKLRRYSGISLGAVLIMAFVLVQPTVQQANAAGIEGIPGFDSCEWVDLARSDPDNYVSMTSVRNKDVVKTVHSEKEIFNCNLDQGGLDVTADVTTYIEIYENITSKEVIRATAFAMTCLIDGGFFSGSISTGTLIGCESYNIPTSPVFVGSNCEPRTQEDIQEQNMVVKGKIAKTIEAQKVVWQCFLSGESVQKKVDLVIFTDIYEDLNTQTRTDVQFHQMRCVVLITDNDDVLRDATVESCQFSTVVEEVPGYDDCGWLNFANNPPEDYVSMTSVRNKDVVKTVHSEKEIFNCQLNQGGLDVVADVTTYIEIYENITSKKVLSATAFATTCLLSGRTAGGSSAATLIGCESYDVPTSPVFVGSNCRAEPQDDIQEQNMVVKGKIAKTIEAQKFVWKCEYSPGQKKVDLVIFTDIYEDLNTQTRTDVQVHQMRCVVLIRDASDALRDATVESCQFSSVEIT